MEFDQTWHMHWYCGFGLLMGKFHQFWQLPAHHMSISLFPDDNLSKCQRIFTKLGMCIDIVEIWFGNLANGKNFVYFWQLSACHTSVFSFLDHNLNKYQGLFTKLGLCINIVEIWFGIANGQILSFYRVICTWQWQGIIIFIAWIQHDCFASMVFALAPSNSVMVYLWVSPK